MSPLRGLGFRGDRLSINMSPLRGFESWMCLVFYKHVAPPGLEFLVFILNAH